MKYEIFDPAVMVDVDLDDLKIDQIIENNDTWYACHTYFDYNPNSTL